MGGGEKENTMTRRIAIISYLGLLCTFAIIGPESKDEFDWAASEKHAVTYFQENWRTLGTLRGAYSVVLYEGLPHQVYEWQELKQELKSKPVVMIDNYSFYRTQIMLKDADIQRLRVYFDSAESFKPSIGSKRCGGFHPDYCLQWITLGGNTVNCHLCFGCEELQAHQGTEYFHCDMITQPLKVILYPYRTNRPLTPLLKGRIERTRLDEIKRSIL